MVAAEKWGHNMEVQEVNIVEVLVSMRNLCVIPPTMVVSTTIW